MFVIFEGGEVLGHIRGVFTGRGTPAQSLSHTPHVEGAVTTAQSHVEDAQVAESARERTDDSPGNQHLVHLVRETNGA